MPVQIPIDRNKVTAFCQRHHVTELALFGSVLREDFRSDSDVDMLVEFAPDVTVTFILLQQVETELAQMIGRKVDLVPKDSINRWIRRQVLQSRELMYGAAS